MLRKKPWAIGEADKVISDTIEEEGNDMIFLTLRFAH